MSFLFKLRLSAGSHHREFCPVSFRIAADSPLLQGSDTTTLHMLGRDGEPVPLQCETAGGQLAIHWIVNRLPAGETAEYAVYAGESGSSHDQPEAEPIRLIEKEDRIDVAIGGSYFTSYVFDPALAKPYIGPVIGPYGASFTRLDSTRRSIRTTARCGWRSAT
ncbi:hypothetical protein [Paenibacillus ginsengarvi]|uniref:hypothetical protein n=1 Tax=Paenibacillus ginsengarvi TaxID=400777 RepID=UPI00131552AD|nr:hypothetical protein [Paenibacillus ginsengarvi]